MTGPGAILIGAGRRAFGSLRLILLLTAANLLFAVLAVLPLYHTVDALGGPLGAGLLETWPHWFDTELRVTGAAVFRFFATGAGLVILLYTLTSCFLTAAALGILHDRDGRFSLGGAVEGAGRYGFVFLRLLLLFLACAWTLKWVAGGQMEAVVEHLAFDWPSQRAIFFLRGGLELVYLILFYLLTFLFDTARVILVVEKRRSALAALLAAVRFVATHPTGTFIVFTALASAQTVVVLLLGGVIRLLTPGGTASIVALLILAEAVVAIRIGFRLCFLESARRWFIASGGTQPTATSTAEVPAAM